MLIIIKVYSRLDTSAFPQQTSTPYFPLHHQMAIGPHTERDARAAAANTLLYINNITLRLPPVDHKQTANAIGFLSVRPHQTLKIIYTFSQLTCGMPGLNTTNPITARKAACQKSGTLTPRISSQRRGNM
jgi:hypothetical protein